MIHDGRTQHSIKQLTNASLTSGNTSVVFLLGLAYGNPGLNELMDCY